jgi:hypothetical protein
LNSSFEPVLPLHAATAKAPAIPVSLTNVRIFLSPILKWRSSGADMAFGPPHGNTSWQWPVRCIFPLQRPIFGLNLSSYGDNFVSNW